MGRTRQLNARPAELAREAVGDEVLVAGSIGLEHQQVGAAVDQSARALGRVGWVTVRV